MGKSHSAGLVVQPVLDHMAAIPDERLKKPEAYIGDHLVEGFLLFARELFKISDRDRRAILLVFFERMMLSLTDLRFTCEWLTTKEARRSRRKKIAKK